jgi:hypothetical protein
MTDNHNAQYDTTKLASLVVDGGFIVLTTLLGLLDYSVFAEPGLGQIAIAANLVVGILGFGMSLHSYLYHDKAVGEIASWTSIVAFSEGTISGMATWGGNTASMAWTIMNQGFSGTGLYIDFVFAN